MLTAQEIAARIERLYDFTDRMDREIVENHEEYSQALSQLRQRRAERAETFWSECAAENQAIKRQTQELMHRAESMSHALRTMERENQTLREETAALLALTEATEDAISRAAAGELTTLRQEERERWLALVTVYRQRLQSLEEWYSQTSEELARQMRLGIDQVMTDAEIAEMALALYEEGMAVREVDVLGRVRSPELLSLIRGKFGPILHQGRLRFPVPAQEEALARYSVEAI